jgi:hypothetical protein
MAKIKADPDLTHSSSRISCKDFREYRYVSWKMDVKKRLGIRQPRNS